MLIVLNDPCILSVRRFPATRADWSEAFELVTSLDVAYVCHASKFTREVLDGLLRIGFLHHDKSSGPRAAPS
jgi:hypothetical protein